MGRGPTFPHPPLPAEAASRRRTFSPARRGGSAPTRLPPSPRRRLHADAPSRLHAEAVRHRRAFPLPRRGGFTPTRLPACTPKRFHTDAPSSFPAEAASRQRAFPLPRRGGFTPTHLPVSIPRRVRAKAATRRRAFPLTCRGGFAPTHLPLQHRSGLRLQRDHIETAGKGREGVAAARASVRTVRGSRPRSPLREGPPRATSRRRTFPLPRRGGSALSAGSHRNGEEKGRGDSRVSANHDSRRHGSAPTRAFSLPRRGGFTPTHLPASTPRRVRAAPYRNGRGGGVSAAAPASARRARGGQSRSDMRGIDLQARTETPWVPRRGPRET